MVTNRKKAASSEAFVNATPDHVDEVKPKTGRKYKSHTLQMNEEEYRLLCKLAEKYQRSHSGVIRFALRQLDKQSDIYFGY